MEQQGTRKLYSITPEGKTHLEENRANAEAILDALERVGGRMEQVREAFAGVGDSDGGASDEVHRARHALKHALRRKHGCDPEEAKRIAEILDRAGVGDIEKVGDRRRTSNLKGQDQQKERFMPNTLLNETFKSVIQDERVRAVIQRLEAERRGARAGSPNDDGQSRDLV